MKRLFAFLAVACLLISCDALTGKEVARLQINELSTEDSVIVKEATLDLKKDDEIGIWSDMDIAYEGNVGMRFKLQMWKDTVQMGQMEIDPTEKNITMGEVKTSFNDKTNWSFTGKNTEIKIAEDGKYTFKAIFMASDNPSLKVTKAELVLKK